MHWIVFALLAPAIYAITNFIDKYILERKIKDYHGLVIYSAIVSFAFGIFCWAFTGFSIPKTNDVYIIIITGIFTIWGLACYFRALTTEETSKVIILMQLIPVMTLCMSIIFLNERISGLQILGFFLILVAIISISFKKSKLSFRLSIPLICILIADILWASANVIFKFVVSITTFSQIIAFESFGMALGGLMLYLFFPSIRNSFRSTKKSLPKASLNYIFVNEFIFITAKLLGFYAISLGPVSLVTVVGSTQVFFGIFYGWLLSSITQKVFKEDVSTNTITKKILLSCLVFMGIWLMQY